MVDSGRREARARGARARHELATIASYLHRPKHKDAKRKHVYTHAVGVAPVDLREKEGLVASGTVGCCSVEGGLVAVETEVAFFQDGVLAWRRGVVAGLQFGWCVLRGKKI